MVVAMVAAGWVVAKAAACISQGVSVLVELQLGLYSAWP